MGNSIAKFTIEAYGQKEDIELYSFDGKAKHHRDLPGIRDGSGATAEALWNTLDRMHEKSLLLPTAGEDDERRSTD